MSAGLPEDGNNHTAPLTPAKVSLASQIVGTLSSGTIPFSLQTGTKFLRTYGVAKDVYMKWGTATVTTSNFDEVIPAGQIVDFFCPAGAAGTAVNFIESTASGTVVIIQK